MSHLSDWRDLGLFPLQDHADDNRGIGRRQALAGVRLTRMDRDGDGDGMLIEIGTENNNLGTAGDIHPWMLWQTADRGKRDMGSWAQSFAAMVVDLRGPGGGPITGGGSGASMLPLRGDKYQSDERYTPKVPFHPSGMPRWVKGSFLTVYPSTEESTQNDLQFNADPRLWCPNANGPGECGTLVVDLQPEREACMDGSDTPGIGGRHARLQSMMRVIPLRPGSGLLPSAGNGIAWNLTNSGTDGLVGYGMVWVDMSTGVPGSGGSGSGPITPGGGGGGAPGESYGFVQEDPLDGGLNGGGVDGMTMGPRPRDFGSFSPAPANARGVAFMAQISARGPFHGGSMYDKHSLGRDRDGNPMNSGHISTDAFFFMDSEHDAPMLYEGDYPHPGPLPLMGKVHLSWDGTHPHFFLDGTRMGMWRWWCEVPHMTPGSGNPPLTPNPPEQPPPPRPPRGPSTPGGPGGPGRPIPPPAPPTGGPRNPGPPGPGGPGGRGGPPRGPVTPGAGGPKGRYIPRSQGGPGVEWYPQPGEPPRPGPTTPPPRGPIAPTVEELRDRRGFPKPTPPAPQAQPEPIPEGGQGSPPWWPGPGPNPNVGTYNQSLGHVGQTSLRDRALFALHHPFMETWSAQAVRPQRWVLGQPSWEHQQGASHADLYADEWHRPQVLGIRSWGAQLASGEWDYVTKPLDSRARGGTTDGGILYCPPEFEPEDYFSLNSEMNTSSPTTQSYVLAALGVSFALGKPNLDGGLNAGSFVLASTTAATEKVSLTQLDANRTGIDLIRAWIDETGGGTEVMVELGLGGSQAVRIPRGDTSQRPVAIAPVGGEVRINTEIGSGSFDVAEFYDASQGRWAWIVSTVSEPAEGDLLFFTGGSWEVLNAGAEGTVLTISGGYPVWASP